MNDPILPSGPLKQSQADPKTNPIHFQRPASTDAVEAAAKTAQKPASAPVSAPGSPVPLLSVLPSAFFTAEQQAAAASEEADPAKADAAFGKSSEQTSAAPKGTDAKLEPESGRAAARVYVPGRSSALLSVLPAAISAEEPEQPEATEDPKPVKAAAPEKLSAQKAAKEDAPAQKKSRLPHIQWTPPRVLCAIALTLALVLFLDQIVMPFVRYQKAVRMETEGNYEQAIAQYAALGNYRDSAQRVDMLQDEKARAMMCDGQYQEALNLLESTGKTHALAADCLYALGVLAYNDGDPKTGLEYVSRLRERFPKYDNTRQLEHYCYYSLGSQSAAKAANTLSSLAPAQRAALYESAIANFSRVQNYFDAAERIKECQYKLAWTYASDWELEKAVTLFQSLSGYLDADDQRLICMFDYVISHTNSMNATAESYLNTLVAADYPGAAEIRDHINGVGFTFELVYGEDGVLPAEVTDLSEVSIRYQISASDGAGPALVQVICTLPGGDSTWSYLNADGSASGTVGLDQLYFGSLPDYMKSGLVTIAFEDCTYGMTLKTIAFDYVNPQDEGGLT